MRGFVISVVVAVAATSAAAEAPLWQMDEGESTLGFVGRQNDNEVRGEFETFTAEIRFDPEDLEGSSLRVEVDMTSAVVEGRERQEILMSSAWFNIEDFPAATFEAEGFEASPDGGYRAVGTLTIRELEHEVPIVFDVSLDAEGAVATAEGSADILRTNYEVGPEQPVFGVAVAPEVEVVFNIEAVRAE